VLERFLLIGILGGGIQGPLGTAATNRPIVPAPGDYDDGEISGMIGRGNRSTRRKPAPVPLCPPQTPHAARTRTRSAAVGSQRLTAWATARPPLLQRILRRVDVNEQYMKFRNEELYDLYLVKISCHIYCIYGSVIHIYLDNLCIP
jgi:tetrahydromethanopterin S-methyltransferase subunit G